MIAPVAQSLSPAEAEEARHVAHDRFMSAPRTDRASAHARYQAELAAINQLEKTDAR